MHHQNTRPTRICVSVSRAANTVEVEDHTTELGLYTVRFSNWAMLDMTADAAAELVAALCAAGVPAPAAGGAA